MGVNPTIRHPCPVSPPVLIYPPTAHNHKKITCVQPRLPWARGAARKLRSNIRTSQAVFIKGGHKANFGCSSCCLRFLLTTGISTFYAATQNPPKYVVALEKQTAFSSDNFNSSWNVSGISIRYMVDAILKLPEFPDKSVSPVPLSTNNRHAARKNCSRLSASY